MKLERRLYKALIELRSVELVTAQMHQQIRHYERLDRRYIKQTGRRFNPVEYVRGRRDDQPRL